MTSSRIPARRRHAASCGPAGSARRRRPAGPRGSGVVEAGARVGAGDFTDPLRVSVKSPTRCACRGIVHMIHRPAPMNCSHDSPTGADEMQSRLPLFERGQIERVVALHPDPANQGVKFVERSRAGMAGSRALRRRAGWTVPGLSDRLAPRDLLAGGEMRRKNRYRTKVPDSTRSVILRTRGDSSLGIFVPSPMCRFRPSDGLARCGKDIVKCDVTGPRDGQRPGDEPSCRMRDGSPVGSRDGTKSNATSLRAASGLDRFRFRVLPCATE